MSPCLCPLQGCRRGGELGGSAAPREGLCSPPEGHSSHCHPALALLEVTIMQSVPAQEGRRRRTVVVALWHRRSKIFCPSRPTCTGCPWGCRQGALEVHAGVEKSTRLGGSGGRLIGEANGSAGPKAWGTALSQQLLLDAETSRRHLGLETARTEPRLWSALP